MKAKLGSFRSNLAERRERLLSHKTYSELGFVNVGGNEEELSRCFWSHCFREKIVRTWKKSQDVVREAWRMGLSDFRKVVFAAKMGLALVLISLLIFLKEPIKDLGRHSVWAILTVVVVFEFSVGATLNKGFNRALGTLSAGGLALGMAELCQLAGDAEEVFIVLSIFTVGFLASYVKLHPTMKPYEYGFRVFLLTYCFIMVSGYKTREFIHTAVTRFLLIALGAAVCLAINIFIYPIWAGEDLHNLVSKNFMGVASSLEGCVDGYLNCVEYARVPSKILTYQASDDPVYSGYRSAVESTSQEDSLLSFAIWEPPHGPYKGLNYPWKNYVKVSGALRHCAFMVLALHGCILSEIQAPGERRQIFRKELKKVGTECAKVLRDVGRKVKSMEKLGPADILFEVNEAAEELQNKIDRKSYILVHSERWEIGGRPIHDKGEVTIMDGVNDGDENKFLEFKSKSEAVLDLRCVTLTPESVFRNEQQSLLLAEQQSLLAERNDEESKAYESARSLSLATFASLLVEFVARLQNVVDSFEELSVKARFRDPIQEEEEAVGGLWCGLCKF